MIAICLIVWASASAVVLAGIAMSARHRAATAADLAALAGAAAVARAQDDAVAASRVACATADNIARANGATLRECTFAGAVIAVTTTVSLPGLGYLGLDSVTARARAGAP
jgi:secretion/DNA translocation related TadE-like protein